MKDLARGFALRSRTLAEQIRRSRQELKLTWAWQHTQTNYPSLHYRYSHDIGNVLAVRMFGFYADHGVVKWKAWPATLSALVATSPLIYAFLIDRNEWIGEPKFLEYGAWLVWFSGLSLLSWLFSFGGVKIFHSLTPDLEAMMTPHGRQSYDRWANVWTSLASQALFSVIFALGATVAFGVAARSGGIYPNLYITRASYLAVFLAAFYVGCGAYWIMGGTVLSWVLHRPGNLELMSFSPVSTPGMELLARCYNLAFFGAATAVSFCLLPLLSWAYRSQDSWTLSFVKGGYFAFAVGAALSIALLPHLFLSLAVARERRKAISEAKSMVESALAGLQNSEKERLGYAVAWLQTAMSSRRSTVSESLLVGIFLGFLTVAAPFVWHLAQ